MEVSLLDDDLWSCDHAVQGTGKSVPLQARGAQRGSRKLRFPNYATLAQDFGKVVSLTLQPLFTPQEIFLVIISVRG